MASQHRSGFPLLFSKQTTGTEEEDDEMSSDGGWSPIQDVDATILPSSNRELFKLVTVAAATAATLGYDVGIMAAAIQPIEAEMHLTGVQKEFAMGSLNFVAALGALLGGRVADRQGRKPTIRLCGWLFVAGTLCMALAPGYVVLLLGRIVTGMGVGVSFVVAPVFISEVAPSSRRGQLNTVFDVAINGGILLGYIVGYVIQVMPFFTSESQKWRLMLGLGAALPVIVLWCLSSLPESPRWLMMMNQKPAAIAVLRRLGSSEAECSETITAMEEELQEERMEDASWGPGKRLAIGLGFWQQATGTEAVLYYSADFLARAGLNSPSKRLLGNIFVGISKLIPELLAMRVVDSIGRKPLLVGSNVLLIITTFSLSLAFWFEWQPIVVVVLLCSVMAAFSFGLGPFTFLSASENLGLTERASGMTLCAAANRCTSGTVALSAVSLYQLLGDAGFFTFYAAVGIGSLLFFTTVPETTGQTLEELAARNRNAGSHAHRQQPRVDVHSDVELFVDRRSLD